MTTFTAHLLRDVTIVWKAIKGCDICICSRFPRGHYLVCWVRVRVSCWVRVRITVIVDVMDI